MKNRVGKQMSRGKSIHGLSNTEVFFKVMVAESNKTHIFFRDAINKSPYLAQIHCSGGTTEGLKQGLGGYRG